MACLPEPQFDMHLMDELFELNMEAGGGLHENVGSPKLQDSNALALTNVGTNPHTGTPGVSGGLAGKLGPAHHSHYRRGPNAAAESAGPGMMGNHHAMLDGAYGLHAGEMLDSAFDAAYELGLADEDMGLPFPDHMDLPHSTTHGNQIDMHAAVPDLSNVLPPAQPGGRHFSLPEGDPPFDHLDAAFEMDLNDDLLNLDGVGFMGGPLQGMPHGQHGQYTEDMHCGPTPQKQRTLRSHGAVGGRGKGLARRASAVEEMIPVTGPLDPSGPLSGPMGLPQHHSMPILPARGSKGDTMPLMNSAACAIPPGGDIRLSVHAGPVTSLPQGAMGTATPGMFSRGPADAAGKRKAGASLTSSRVSAGTGDAADGAEDDDEHQGPDYDDHRGEPTAKRKKKSQNEKIAELQKQVDSLRSQNMELKKRAGKLASDKTKIIDCLTHLTALVTQKKGENERLRTKINTLQATVCDDSAPGLAGAFMGPDASQVDAMAHMAATQQLGMHSCSPMDPQQLVAGPSGVHMDSAGAPSPYSGLVAPLPAAGHQGALQQQQLVYQGGMLDQMGGTVGLKGGLPSMIDMQQQQQQQQLTCAQPTPDMLLQQQPGTLQPVAGAMLVAQEGLLHSASPAMGTSGPCQAGPEPRGATQQPHDGQPIGHMQRMLFAAPAGTTCGVEGVEGSTSPPSDNSLECPDLLVT